MAKMMDFDNILDIASQNQGHGNAQQKRYSLQAGPPKKDPRSKGVNPAAVQALLKKQFQDTKKKEIQVKKKKEELIAKRVELKSDRKARAMASRTKDNFKGYNGVPIVELPKKRRSKHEMEEDRSMNQEGFRYNSVDPEDDEDNYEYEQSDSEEEPEPIRPGKTSGVNSSSKPSFKKPSGPPKPAPPPMNFADLLKLAEKKQFEPVDLKPKATKKEERLRTADEIRELEMERKAKRQGPTERERDGKSQSSSSSIRKGTSEKEQKSSKPQKNSLDREAHQRKKTHQTQVSDKSHSSSKASVGDRERERPKASHSDRDRPKTSSSGATNGKFTSKATSSQVSAKQGAPMSSSSHKSSTSSDLSLKKESSSLVQARASGIPGTRPPGTAGQKSQYGASQQTRPGQGSSFKQGPTVGGHRSAKGEQPRPGTNPAVKSSGNSVMRPSLGGPSKAGSQPQQRPGGTPQGRPGGVPQVRPGVKGMQGHPGGSAVRPPGMGPGRPVGGPTPGRPVGGPTPGRPVGGPTPGRPIGGGPTPGRPTGSMGSGPGRPKCTVVSETISSKNFGGPRGGPPRRGMPQRPGMHPGPMNRPPGAMMPPITSAYKRQYEDEEEYDSEMDDFIDDGGDEQSEISKHIKEIFGYDRSRYRDESDYALKFMESSWKDMQKEEARSLKMAVQEDLEEERKEEEQWKNVAKKRKKN